MVTVHTDYLSRQIFLASHGVYADWKAGMLHVVPSLPLVCRCNLQRTS